MAWRAGLAAVVLLAGACGSGGDGDSGDGDGGLRKLPLGAVGSGRSSAAMAEDSAAMIAPAQPIEYRVADGADDPPATATAYELVPMPVDEMRAKVAKALDVDAERVEVGAGGYDWYYNGNLSPDTAVSSSSSSPACAPDEKCADPGAPPSPPTTVRGVPSAADAEARVRDILESMGASLDGRFEVFGEDGFNRTVQFTPSVDGVPVVGLQTNIAFGADARIEYANGLLAEAESLGEYPLVGLEEAVDRLREGFGSGGVRTMGAPEPAIDPAATSGSGGGTSGSTGTAEDASSSGAASSGTGSSGSGGVAVAEPTPAAEPEPTPPCAPGEPCTTPPAPPEDQPTMTIEPDRSAPTVPLEPQVVEITGAELSLQLVAAGCPGDPVYLVPTFDLLPGPAASVIAVEDDAIAGATSDGRDIAQPCPDVPPSDLPAGKPEPAPMPPDRGATEPAPLPADTGREPANP